MKIIVTGASGFVGQHLLRVLLENDNYVIAVCRSNHCELSGGDNLKVIPCDLDMVEGLPELLVDRDFDCCIHLAWEGANGAARGDMKTQFNNVERTVRLCEVLPRLGVKRFVGIGTLAEKDVNHYIPMDGATPNKVACYGAAKLAAQYMSKIVCTQLYIDHIWCQLSNLYGIGDRTGNFVNFASKLMLAGQRASFTAGTQMYDFVYITDIANGIYLAAKNGRSNTAYYLGSGQPRQLKEFIAEIRDAVDPDIPLYLGEVPFNGVCLPDEEFDCSKLMKDTGYRAEVPFEVGIKKTVAWLKAQAGG